MSAVKVKAALEVGLNGMSPALSTAWENIAFTPEAGTAYQEVNLLFAPPVNNEYGNGYREEGIMQITLMYPIQTGANAAMARAELIRTTFKRGATFVKDTVTVTVSNTPEIAPGAVEGDRYALPVKVRFFSNISSS